MRRRRILITLRLMAICVLFAALIAPERPAFGDERHQLNILIGQRNFDYLVWELQALWSKGKVAVRGSQYYLDKGQRSALVLRYLELIAEDRQLNAAMEQSFAGAAETRPEASVATLSAEQRQVRQEIDQLQPVAEAIMEEQLASILVEQGFEVLGRAWPPVSMRMTPLPLVLVVSPRDKIEQIYNISLKPGMPIPERARLEEQIFEELDRSALVVAIGGVGIYPAMVLERSDINWVMETMAHEWAHHWLTLHPLGIRYAANPSLRTINETVANMFGKEIGPLVVARYYPHLLPPETEREPSPPAEQAEGTTAFDLRAEMAITRVETDRLLKAGQIEEAEAYMEARRQIFVEEGYLLRKLNQAYFAFFGAYADRPGATGSDPIGPLISRVRQQTVSIRKFMSNIATVTSFAALQQLAGDD